MIRVTVKKRVIKFKNIFFFNKKKNLNLEFRKFYFWRLIKFVEINSLNRNIFFEILQVYYYFLWNIFFNTKNKIYYYCLIKVVLNKYYLMFFNQRISYSNTYTTTNNSFQFSSVKNNFAVNFSLNEINSLQKFFMSKAKHLTIKQQLNEKKFYRIISFTEGNQDYSKFKLYFLRVQRRYNKRRYSKVRVTSRPSFFAGITLSSILVGLFWGGTIKSVDWLTSLIIVVDINFFILFIFIYFIFRIHMLKYLNYNKFKNKIKLVNILQKMFTFNIFINNGKNK